ncbi:MAG: FemAB family XrtA/PEP-CTERM system-associated protein [Gammaproteobacteria bacterium]
MGFAEASSIAVHDLKEADRARWDEFVNAHPEGSFMHLSGWQRVIRDGFGHRTYFMWAESDGKLVGVLPLVRVKSLLFGDSLISTPFCVYGGAIAETDAARLALEENAARLAEELGVDYLELRDRVDHASDWPKKSLYVTFRKEISEDHEANMKAIPRKQRAMVRKGLKAGLETEFGQELDRFYQIYSESVRNLGTPVFGKRFFRVLLDEFRDAIDILMIKHEGQDIAGVLSFYFRDEVLPYYGGGSVAARGAKANDFMYWSLMSSAADRGCRVFDYGRSKEGVGSYSFKKNWGFEPAPLHYRYHLVKADAVPDLSPMNPKYQLFIKMWKKLPLPISQMIGPHLARNLG